MIITIISECEKKSWIKTRRIVSSYLFQIGRRVWQGHISEEGLKDLSLELKKSSSKNTSIICHRHKGTKSSKVEWIIGNKKRFNEDGLFSYSQRNIISKYEIYKNSELLLLKEITGLSGLLHDLGKGVHGFQQKLVKAKNKEQFNQDIARHELISTILSSFILDKLQSIKNSSDIKDLFNNEGLNSLTEFKDYLFNSLKKDDLNIRDVEGENPILENIFTLNNWENKTIESSILWLVLTHHKLPMGKIIESSERNGRKVIKKEFSKNVYIYQYLNLKEGMTVDKEFFNIQSNKMPWNSSQWCNKAFYHIKNIQNLIKKLDTHNLFNNDYFIYNLIYKARTSLIYADYIESINKDKCLIQDSDILLYANTYIDDTDKKIFWGDNLGLHLEKVGKSSLNFFDRIFMRGDDFLKRLKYLSIKDRPEQLKITNNISSDSNFYWQNAIANNLKKILKDNNANDIGGFFGILLSKTGSGKTKASPTILNAISSKLRFSLALGMRTLTTQSYNVYLSDLIGFNKNDVALLIGSRSLDMSKNEILYSGSDTIEMDNEELTVVSEEQDVQTELLEMYSKSKDIDLISSPISVMTIDHIIKAVSCKKGVDHKIVLHLMNTDLILDEVDDYDATDMVSIEKLIYLSASFGRKIIISSATTSSSIIENLSESYRLGYEMYKKTTDSKNDASYAFMSHMKPYLTIKKSNKKEDILKEYNSFLENFTKSIEKENVKHIAKQIDISNKENSFCFNILDSECINLHKDNFIIDPKTNKELSFGFVRFNNVNSAQDYAFHLSKSNSFNNYEVKILCYHSKMLLSSREKTESFLNEVLNRNVKNPWDHGLIKKELKKTSKKGIIYIISTTNIQETGRDHDYDWMISEPIGNKSLIQSCGRVGRHRHHLIAKEPNIGVLTKTLRGYNGDRVPFGFPGIESDFVSKNDRSIKYKVSSDISANIKDKLNHFNIPFSVSEEEPEVCGILNMSFFNKKIDSTSSIKKPNTFNSDIIESLNYIRNSDYLNISSNSSNIGTYISRSDIKLNALHWGDNEFRKTDYNKRQVDIFQKDLRKNEYSKFNWTATSKNKKINIIVNEYEIDNSRFILFFDTKEDCIDIAKSLNKQNDKVFIEMIASCRLTINRHNSYVFFNEFLGFRTSKLIKESSR